MRHHILLILALLLAACAPPRPQARSSPTAPSAGLPAPAAASPASIAALPSSSAAPTTPAAASPAPTTPAAASPAPTTPPAAAAAAPSTPPGLPRGTVVHVVDGDTLDVNLAGTVERIRLIGINTPETVKPNTPVECFGREASAYAKQLLNGQAVSVEADPSQDTRDKYGRLLAYVWLDDGRLANLDLVVGGYAYEYTYDQPYAYQRQFKQAQQDAQVAQRGLWSPATCNGVHGPVGAATTAPAADQGAPASSRGCAAAPDPASAPNAPIMIVAVDKRAELVRLKNVGSAPIDLSGWTMCSLRGAQRHPLAGVIAAGETNDFPGAGPAIWSNGSRDDGALFDAQGRLVSYWRDGT